MTRHYRSNCHGSSADSIARVVSQRNSPFFRKITSQILHGSRRVISQFGKSTKVLRRARTPGLLRAIEEGSNQRPSPRPYYPKSWLWPEEYAATLIQKTVRQYFVQREEDVQEMRDFWKKLEMEPNIPDMQTNPFLAKKFASLQSFRKS